MEQMGKEEKGVEWERRKRGGKGRPCERLCCSPLSPEKMCVFIFVCAIYWPSWALSQGRACSGTARGVPLGARHRSPGALPRASCSHGYWGELPSGAGWQGPEDLEGTAPCCIPEQPTDLHSCVRSTDYIISFPTSSHRCSLDAFIQPVINLFTSKLGSCCKS